METKCCNRCKQVKSVEEFNWMRKAQGQRQSCCKKCSHTKDLLFRQRKKAGLIVHEVFPKGYKRCGRCKVMKPLEDFHYMNKQLNRYHSRCRTCKAEVQAAKLRADRANGIPPKDLSAYMQPYYQTHREAIRLRARIAARARMWNNKLKVLTHYGSKCVCCGETNPHFLQIDHVLGGGGVHRRQLKAEGIYHFDEWLIKHNFPKVYRILCANCNGAFGHYGFCPHQGKGNQLPLL